MQLVQRRMQIRTVEALVVVEDDQLPVRLDVVHDATAEAQVGHLPGGEPIGKIRELRAQAYPRLPILPLPPILPILPLLPVPPSRRDE